MSIRNTITIAFYLMTSLSTAQNSLGYATETKAAPASLLSALDTNGNWTLEASEIALAASSLKRLDGNNDGVLSNEELQPPSGRRLSGSEKKASAALLAVLDTNHDGQLDTGEIANAQSSLLVLDINHDEKLSKSELNGPEESSSEPDRGQGSPNDHAPKSGENKTPH